MDFEQWKPLTGRGDPLRNDPTYDYEPPLLERVHYWADEAKAEREHVPEKKSEVLMLGVSSRKPSVTPRPHPPRRQQFRIPSQKYEDFTYKLSNNYPMTILVPPPLPPPGHQPALFVLNQVKPSPKPMKSQTAAVNTKETTNLPEELTSLYALQASNLIYQSSTISHNWIDGVNDTLSSYPQKPVTSDYAGWGPTTPLNEYEIANDTHNLISNDHFEIGKNPYSFYKPMLSESPPPPEIQSSLVPTFLPTSLPPTTPYEETSPTTSSEATWSTETTTYKTSTENQDYYEDTTTETATISSVYTHSMPIIKPQQEVSLLDMLAPMMTMPIINGPERTEDNLYPHASESMQIFKERKPDPIINLETMQPPPLISSETTKVNHKSHNHGNINVNKMLYKIQVAHNHDPYLHMRYTTPVPTPSASDANHNNITTETSAPMYLIIQGHSKVKTYGSKPKANDEDRHTSNNEIPKPNETNEVKHLHPKQKFAKKLNITEEGRKSKAQNLQALVDHGHGSIEIQEADIGIKYDVSDGSNIPLEVYRKGIVVTDENNYRSGNKIRTRRQIDLEDFLPFDEDSLEEYVYNFFEGKKNDTSLTGVIAQAVTSDAASAVDELEDEDDTNDTEQDEDDR